MSTKNKMLPFGRSSTALRPRDRSRSPKRQPRPVTQDSMSPRKQPRPQESMSPQKQPRPATQCDFWGEVHKAEALLRARFSDPQKRGAFTLPSLVDEIMRTVSPAAGPKAASGGSGSVLLLGEAGSGKTHAVESCVSKLREVHGSSLVVIRAYGGAYSTDVECIRHLATQLRGGVLDQTMLPRNASFEHGMKFIRSILRESLRCTRHIVIVLEKFEAFCSSKSRQTLLYNLFDIAEEASVRLSIIGTSEKTDVTDTDSLEKRIKSRFSMHHLYTYFPKTIHELVAILLEKLRLSDDWGFGPNFVKEFNTRIEAALRLRAKHWDAYLELGKPPKWFLSQCLPVVALLREASLGDMDTTGPRVATDREVQHLFINALSEDAHVVLLALLKLHQRQANPTLSLVLYEIKSLHGACSGKSQMWTSRFNSDRYAAAFDTLLQARFVDMAGSFASTLPSAGGNLPRFHRSCKSNVIGLYAEFAKDLKSSPGHGHNPLRALPEPIKQWVLA